MSDVWVMAIIRDDGWELGGVFTDRELAVKACTEPTDAVFSVPLDRFLGRKTQVPPGQFFPLAQEGS